MDTNKMQKERATEITGKESATGEKQEPTLGAGRFRYLEGMFWNAICVHANRAQKQRNQNGGTVRTFRRASHRSETSIWHRCCRDQADKARSSGNTSDEYK